MQTEHTPQQGPSTITVPSPTAQAWTTPSVVLLVAGLIIALLGTGCLVGGGSVLWANGSHRDDAGYLVSDTQQFSTSSNALVVEDFEVNPDLGYLIMPDSIVGKVRLRATPTDADGQVFVGLAPADQVSQYLNGVDYATIEDFDKDPRYREHAGGGTVPAANTIDWVARSQGTGTQTLDWSPQSGTWSLVIANSDASPDVSVRMDVATSTPVLPAIGWGLVIGGLILIGIGGAMAAAAFFGATRRR